MGFIDWHGNKEDHYEDVLEYAKERQTERIRAENDRLIRIWFSEKLGSDRFATMQSPDVMKLLIKEYMGLDRMYTEWIRGAGNTEGKPDPAQLWNDLWLYSIQSMAEKCGMESAKKQVLMTVFSEKMFHLKNQTSIQRHLQEFKKNRRYVRYFRECFEIGAEQKLLFFKWLGRLTDGRRDLAVEFIEGYQKSMLLMAYHLYLSMEEKGNFFISMQQEWNALSDMQKNLSEGIRDGIDERRLMNPLYRAKKKTLFQEQSLIKRVLFFHYKKQCRQEEGEIEMVEEFYAAIEEKRISVEQITSILPEEIKKEVREGRLPDVRTTEIQGLRDNEKVCFLDHTVLFQGKESDGEVSFRSFKGTLILTDQKIYFHGNGSLEIPYDHIEQITAYDIAPELLEVVCNGKSNFFQVPDMEIAYRILKQIANKEREEKNRGKETAFHYEEWINKADLGACVFAFEGAMEGNMPKELREHIRTLNQSLKGLKKTMERYPGQQEEIYRFLDYYIPEAIRLVAAYQKYEEAGLDAGLVNHIYEKVDTAVKTLSGAVKQKMEELYHLNTMDTVARAETLSDILGQDGYGKEEW